MNRDLSIADLKLLFKYLSELGFERLPLEIDDTLCDNGLCLFKEKALEALRSQIVNCQRCRLSQRRKNLVFGEGNPEARLMFIGEAPGAEEDLQGRPFVGPAGELLTRLINKMGFKREDVYIANTVKCRPPNNRKPREDELSQCMPFLKKQIDIINPTVIMTLGDVAAKALLGDIGSITRVRGKLFKYKNIPVVPTFHPSYLLRNPKAKWFTWEDAQKVLKILKEEST
ncbi:MAG: uracil-DNA glycosylase [Nitrospirae bacterium]|nr:uracil-DNA glycosylase [Nitrospirota bacterium]